MNRLGAARSRKQLGCGHRYRDAAFLGARGAGLARLSLFATVSEANRLIFLEVARACLHYTAR